MQKNNKKNWKFLKVFFIFFIFLLFWQSNKLFLLVEGEDGSEINQESQTSPSTKPLTIFSSEESCSNSPLKRVFLPDPEHLQALYDPNNEHYQGYLKEINSFQEYENLSQDSHSDFFFKSTPKLRFQQFLNNAKETSSSSGAVSKPKWFTEKLPEEENFFSQETDNQAGFWNNVRWKYLKKILKQNPETQKLRPYNKNVVGFKNEFKLFSKKLKIFIEIISKNYFWLKNLFGEKIPICEKIRIKNQEKVYKHFIFIHDVYFGRWYKDFNQNKTITFNKEWFGKNSINYRFVLALFPILHFNMNDLKIYLRKIIKRKILDNFGKEILYLQKSGITKIKMNKWIKNSSRPEKSKKKIETFYKKFPKFLPTHIGIEDLWENLNEQSRKNSFLTLSLDKLKILTDPEEETVTGIEGKIKEDEFSEIDQDDDFNAKFFHLLKFALLDLDKLAESGKKNYKLIKKNISAAIDEKVRYLFEILLNNLSLIKNAGLQKIFFGEKRQYLDLEKIQIKYEDKKTSLLEIHQIDDNVSIENKLKTSLKIETRNNSKQYDYLEYFTANTFQEVVKIIPYLQKNIFTTKKTLKEAFEKIVKDNINKKLGILFNALKNSYSLLEDAEIKNFSLRLSQSSVPRRFELAKLGKIKELGDITELEGQSDDLKEVFYDLNKSLQYQKRSQPDLTLRQIFINLVENKFKKLWIFLKPNLDKIVDLKLTKINYNKKNIDLSNLIKKKDDELQNLDTNAFTALNIILLAVGRDYSQEAGSEQIEVYNQKMVNSFKEEVKTLIDNNFFASLPNFLKKFDFSKVNKLFLNESEKQSLSENLQQTIDVQTFQNLIDEGKDFNQISTSFSKVYNLTPKALYQLFVLSQVQKRTRKTVQKIFDDAIYRQYKELWVFLQEKKYVKKLLAAEIFSLNLNSDESENILDIKKLDLSEDLKKIVENIDTTSTPGGKQKKNLIFIKELTKLINISTDDLTEIFDSAVNKKLSRHLETIQNSPLLKAGLSELKYPLQNPNNEKTILLADFSNVSKPIQLSADNLDKLFFFGIKIVEEDGDGLDLPTIIKENIAVFWEEKLAWFKHKETSLNVGEIKKKMDLTNISQIVINEPSIGFSKTLVLEHFWNFSKVHKKYLETLEILKILFLDKEYTKGKLHQIFDSAINDKYQTKLVEFKTESFKLSVSEKLKYTSLLKEGRKVSDFSIEELQLFLEFIGEDKKSSLSAIINNKLKKRLEAKWKILKNNLGKLEQIEIISLEIEEPNKDSKSLNLDKLSPIVLINLSSEAIQEVEKLTVYSEQSIHSAIEKAINTKLSTVWSFLIDSENQFLLKLEIASISTIPLNKIDSSLNGNVDLSNLFLQKTGQTYKSLINLQKEELGVLLKIKKINQEVIKKLFQEKFVSTWNLLSDKLEWREKLVAAQISELTLGNKEIINISFWLKFAGDVFQLTSKNINDLVKLKANNLLPLIQTSLDNKFKTLINNFSTKMWLLKILKLRQLGSDFSILNIKKEITDINTKKTHQLKKETIEELIKFWGSDLTPKLNNALTEQFQDIWNSLKNEEARLKAAQITTFDFNNKLSQIVSLNKLWANTQKVLVYQEKQNFLVEFWEELAKLKTQISDVETLNNKIIGAEGIINNKFKFIWNLVQDYLKEVVVGEIFSLTGKINFDFSMLAKKNTPTQSGSSLIEWTKKTLLELVKPTIKPNILTNKSLSILVNLDKELTEEAKKLSSAFGSTLTDKKKNFFQAQITELLLDNFATVWEKISIYLQKFFSLNEYYEDPELLKWNKLTLETFLPYKDSSELSDLLKKWFVSRTRIVKTTKETFINSLLLWKKKNLDKTIDLDVLLTKRIDDNSLAIWLRISPWLKKIKKIGLREIVFGDLEVEEEIKKSDVSGLFKYLNFSETEKSFTPSQFQDGDFAIFLKFFSFTLDESKAKTFFENKINAFLKNKLAVFQKPKIVAKIKSLGKDQEADYQDLKLSELIGKTPSQLTSTQFDALIKLTKGKTVADIEAGLSQDITTKILKVWNWIKPFLKKINLFGVGNIVFLDKNNNNITFNAGVLRDLKQRAPLNSLQSQQIKELNKLNSLLDERTFIKQLTSILDDYQNLKNKLLFFQGRTGDSQETLLINKIKISQLYDVVLNKNTFNIKSLLETQVNSVIDLTTANQNKNDNTLDILILFKNKNLNDIITLLIKSVDSHFSDSKDVKIWQEFKKNIPNFQAIQTNQFKLENEFLKIIFLKKINVEISKPSDSEFSELAYSELEKIRQAITKGQIININKLNKGYQDTITHSLESAWQKLQPWLTKFFYSEVSEIISENKVINISSLIAQRKKSQVYQLNSSELTILFSFKDLDIDSIAHATLNNLLTVWTELFPYLEKLKAVKVSGIIFKNKIVGGAETTIGLQDLYTKLDTLREKTATLTFFQLEEELKILYQIYQNKKSSENNEAFAARVLSIVKTSIQSIVGNKWQKLIPFLLKLKFINQNSVTLENKEINLVSLYSLEFYPIDNVNIAGEQDVGSAFIPLSYNLPIDNLLKVYQIVASASFADVFAEKYLDTKLYKKRFIFLKSPVIYRKIIASQLNKKDSDYEVISKDEFREVEKPSELTVAQWKSFVKLIKDKEEADIKKSISDDVNEEVLTSWEKIKGIIPQLQIVKFSSFNIDDIKFDTTFFFDISLSTPQVFTIEQITELKKIPSNISKTKIMDLWKAKLNSGGNLKENWIFFQNKVQYLQKSALNELILSNNKKIDDSFWSKNNAQLSETGQEDISQLNSNNLIILAKTKGLTTLENDLKKALNIHLSDTWEILKKYLLKLFVTKISTLKHAEKIFDLSNLTGETIVEDTETIKPTNFINMQPQSLKELAQLKSLNWKEQNIRNRLIIPALKDKLSKTWESIKGYLPNIKVVFQTKLTFQIDSKQLTIEKLLSDFFGKSIKKLIDLSLGSLKELLALSELTDIEELESKFSHKFTNIWNVLILFLEKLKASGIVSFVLPGGELLNTIKKTINLNEFDRYINDEELLNDFKFLKQPTVVLENLTKIVSFLENISGNAPKFQQFLEKLIDDKFLTIWEFFKKKIEHLQKSQISNFIIDTTDIDLNLLFAAKNTLKPHQLLPQLLSSLLVFSKAENFEQFINITINTKLQSAWTFLKKDYLYLKALGKTQFLLETTPNNVFLNILHFQPYWDEEKNFITKNTNVATLNPDALQELVKFFTWIPVQWSAWLGKQKESTFNDQWTETFRANLRRLKLIKVSKIKFQGVDYDLTVLINQVDQTLAQLESQSLGFLKTTSLELKNDLNNLNSLIVKQYIKENFQEKLSLLKKHLDKLSVFKIKTLNFSESDGSQSLKLSVFAEKANIDAFWDFPDLMELAKLKVFPILKLKVYIATSLNDIIDKLKNELINRDVDYLAKWKNLGINQLFIKEDRELPIVAISEENLNLPVLDWQLDTVREFYSLSNLFILQKKTELSLTEVAFWERLFNKTLKKKFSSHILIWQNWKEKISSSNLVDLEITSSKPRVSVGFLNKLTDPFSDWGLQFLKNLNAFAGANLLEIIKNNINKKFSDIFKELTASKNNFLARLFIIQKSSFLLLSPNPKEGETEEKSISFNLNPFYNWVLTKTQPSNVALFEFRNFSSFEKLNEFLQKIFQFTTKEPSEFSSILLKELVKITKNRLSLTDVIQKTINSDETLGKKLQKLILKKNKLLNFPEIWEKKPKKYASLEKFLNEINESEFLSSLLLTDLTLESTWVLNKITFSNNDVSWNSELLEKTINDFYEDVFLKIIKNKEKITVLNLKKIKFSNLSSAKSKVIDLEPFFQDIQNKKAPKTFNLSQEALIILKNLAIQSDYSGDKIEKAISKNINVLYQKTYETFLKIKPILNLINKFILPTDDQYKNTISLKNLASTSKIATAARVDFKKLAALMPFLKFKLGKSLATLLKKDYKKELRDLNNNYQRLKIAQLRNLYLKKNDKIHIVPIINAKKKSLVEGSFDELLAKVKIFAKFKNKNINKIVDKTLNRKYSKKWQAFQPFLLTLYNADIKTIEVNTEVQQETDDLLKNKDKATPAEISDEALQELIFFANKTDEEIKQLVDKEIKNKYTTIWKFLNKNYQIFNKTTNSLKTFSQKNKLDLNKIKDFLKKHKDKAVEELPAPVFLELQKIYDKDMKFLLIKPNKTSDSFFSNGEVLVVIFIFVIFFISILGIYIAVVKGS